MALEHTLALLKPDTVAANHTGAVTAAIEEAGLRVIAHKRLHLTRKQAEAFYAEHSARGFFNDLTAFISSGPLEALVLEGEGAVAAYRTLMGATNPKEAAAGTLRARFAKSIDENAVHGSDRTASAAREIPFFFAAIEYI